MLRTRVTPLCRDGVKLRRPPLLLLLAFISTSRPVESTNDRSERSMTIRLTSVSSTSRMQPSSFFATERSSSPERLMTAASSSRSILIFSASPARPGTVRAECKSLPLLTRSICFTMTSMSSLLHVLAVAMVFPALRFRNARLSCLGGEALVPAWKAVVRRGILPGNVGGERQDREAFPRRLQRARLRRDASNGPPRYESRLVRVPRAGGRRLRRGGGGHGLLPEPPRHVRKD